MQTYSEDVAISSDGKHSPGCATCVKIKSHTISINFIGKYLFFSILCNSVRPSLITYKVTLINLADGELYSYIQSTY